MKPPLKDNSQERIFFGYRDLRTLRLNKSFAFKFHFSFKYFVLLFFKSYATACNRKRILIHYSLKLYPFCYYYLYLFQRDSIFSAWPFYDYKPSKCRDYARKFQVTFTIIQKKSNKAATFLNAITHNTQLKSCALLCSSLSIFVESKMVALINVNALNKISTLHYRAGVFIRFMTTGRDGQVGRVQYYMHNV